METRWDLPEDSRVKREMETELVRKRFEEKEQKKCLKEEIVDTPCESNVNRLLKDMFHQKLYILIFDVMIRLLHSMSIQFLLLNTFFVLFP